MSAGSEGQHGNALKPYVSNKNREHMSLLVLDAERPRSAGRSQWIIRTASRYRESAGSLLFGTVVLWHSSRIGLFVFHFAAISASDTICLTIASNAEPFTFMPRITPLWSIR